MVRKLLTAIVASLVLVLPASAFAQSSPSAYTYGTRYDAMGRATGTIAPDPDGAGPLKYPATRNTYDVGGRLVKVEAGELQVWKPESISPAYWGADFVVKSIIETTYNGLDQKLKVQVEDANGSPKTITQYSYDAVGRLQCTAVWMNAAAYGSLPSDACTLGTEGSNGPDRITKNVYDAAGQLLQVRKAVGTPFEQAYATYSYTPNGQQEYVIDANGNRAQMVYDGFDRLSKWIFPSATRPTGYNPSTQANALATAGAINASDYEQYGYDANGNRKSLRKRDGSTLTYTYDALNRVTIKTVPPRAGLPATDARSVYYGYDLQGHQLYTRFDSASGEGVSSAWDGLGQLTSTTETMDGVTRTISYLYDADGNRTRMTFPDGNYVTYTYDGLDRPLTILRSGSATIASYIYNNAGYRTGFNGGVTTGYAYDGIGRLSTLTNNLTASSYNNQWTFGYNPASQLIQTTRSNDTFAWTGAVNVNRAYTTNGLNQYTGSGSATLVYDANGNLTSDGSTTFTYDIENRMVGASGAHTATLRYDPMGRLYETVGASGTTRFLYDGDALVGEYDTSGNLLRRYVHGADLKADDPIAWYEGAAFSSTSERFMRPDWQGSIVLVTNSAGSSVVAVNTYDEYGIPGGNNAGRFQYTGQAWEQDLGMYYYKARMYSPTLGRFMQTDPIGYKDQINLYAYVANDPINATDPTGMCGDADNPARGGAGNSGCIIHYQAETQSADSDSKSSWGMQSHFKNGDGKTMHFDPKAYHLGTESNHGVTVNHAINGKIAGSSLRSAAVTANETGKSVSVTFRTTATSMSGIGNYTVDWKGTLSVSDGKYSISATGTVAPQQYDWKQDSFGTNMIRDVGTWLANQTSASEGTSYQMLPTRDIDGNFYGSVNF